MREKDGKEMRKVHQLGRNKKARSTNEYTIPVME